MTMRRRPSSLLGLPLALVLLCTSACERPFVEEAAPRIEVLTPDPEVVQSETDLPLRVRVTSFRAIDRVTLDNRPLTPLGDDVWGDTLRARRGVTAHVLRAYDAEGLEGRDTLYLAHLPLTATAGADLPPSGRGGHTATLLGDGRVLVAGGTATLDGPALESVLLLDPDEGSAPALAGPLTAARTGHTASRLPDGRVLVVGGARTDSLQARADLVETAEVFDPATERFRPVPVVGTPIRRAFHAAATHVVAGETVVDLYGGWTVASDGRRFIRTDVRRLLLRGDTLFAGATVFDLDEAVPGLTVTPLGGPAGAARFLLTGTYFARGTAARASLVVSYEPSGAISLDAAPNPYRARTHHAAVPTSAAGNAVLVVGGRGASAADVFAAPEVYAEPARRFFRYPPLPDTAEELLRRAGGTATLLSSGRILLVGGYTPAGNGTSSTAYILIFD